jgi:hypothetical protein
MMEKRTGGNKNRPYNTETVTTEADGLPGGLGRDDDDNDDNDDNDGHPACLVFRTIGRGRQ